LNQPRVLLADNDHAVLEAEIALLAPILMLGTAADGAALVSKARNLLPDVLVTGISMPIFTEVATAHKSSSRHILKAGALGYVQKYCMKRHLVPAIQAALAGHPYFH
jgi:DNA-binding NarL/FixJ family response regulator